MKPKRPRKRSLTSVIPQTSASRRVTQATISSFHTLLKRRTRLRSQLATGSIESVEPLTNTLTQVEAEIVAIGGLNAYQDASKLGQSVNRGGDSSRVLIDWLQERRSSLASHLDTKGKGKDVSHKGIVLKYA